MRVLARGIHTADKSQLMLQAFKPLLIEELRAALQQVSTAVLHNNHVQLNMSYTLAMQTAP